MMNDQHHSRYKETAVHPFEQFKLEPYTRLLPSVTYEATSCVIV